VLVNGKIGLEEHFAISDTIEDSRAFLPDQVWSELKQRLTDIHDERLRQMDRYGMEMMILSLNAPAVQAVADGQRADDLARRANDYLAEQVQRRPGRFQGFAALPMQDPERAIRELERAIVELGFRGALVNGFSQAGDPDHAIYYDAPQYGAFWEAIARLDVPFYLHPRNPLPCDARIYAGHEWLLGPAWAFGHETAVHALRLMGSGLFDRHPQLQLVLGHLGEGLPYNMWRIDNCNAWVGRRHAHAAKHPIAHYFRNNVYLTTSGNFRTQSLLSAILEIGADRVMFSTDWPFENVGHAADWFDAAPISENDRVKIGRTNARRLFRLDRPPATRG
jgi:2,3-dihydroxybenzoate decarboxylase